MSAAIRVLWDLDEEPDGNVRHLAANGITKEEAEDVLRSGRAGESRTSGRPAAFGPTSTGKHIMVVYDEIDDDPKLIYPVTAFEVPEPRSRRHGS